MSRVTNLWKNLQNMLQDPVDIWTQMFLQPGHMSSAGVQITDQSMLGLPSAYAAVRAISEVVGQLPLELMRRVPNGGIEPARDHHLYFLFADSPNNYQTPSEFVRLMQARLCIRHNTYAFIEKSRGKITRLMPINPLHVQIRAEERTGMSVYDVSAPEGWNEKDIPASRILHIRGFTDNGFLGWGPTHVLRDALGSAVAAERYSQRVLANGAHIPGFFRAPNLRENTREIVERQMAEFRGVDNAGKSPIFPGSVEWVKMGMTAQEAEILGTRKLLISDMARMFRVPPHIIGDMEHATYSNIYHQSREFLDYSVVHWLNNWEQRLGFSLLTPAERRPDRNGSYLFFKFNMDQLLRGHVADRYEGYQKAIQSGWMTRNEVRAKEDMPHLPGLDEPLVQVNMAPSDLLAEVLAGNNDGEEEGEEDDLNSLYGLE